MEKPLKLIVIGILVLITGGVVYLSTTGGSEKAVTPVVTMQQSKNKTTADSSKKTQTNMTSEQAPQQPIAETVPATGTYVDYSAEQFQKTTGTRILYFHAKWCPQCRALEADILASQIPAGVTIFKIDYDSNQGLRQQYGVRLQTTLVLVDQNGNKQKDFVAYDTPTLQAVRQNLL